MNNAKYIQVSAEVRYWEDATVNGIKDKDGTLIPLRHLNNWEPTIRLSDGLILDWTQGTTADIHYKVCDAGLYWLLDDNLTRIAKYKGHYVPDSILCQNKDGYGDYIIMTVLPDGHVKGWNPKLVFENWA